jgi:hypothetical protein
VTENYFVGREFEFAAEDRNGHVVLLSSAGYGPIPIEVLDRVVVEDRVVEELAELPLLCSSIVDPGRSGDLGYGLRYSDRGIYFDWEHWSGPNRRVSRPAVPLSWTDVEHAIGAVDRIQLPLDAESDVAIDLERLGIHCAQ